MAPEQLEVDPETVDYDESDEETKSPSSSDEASGGDCSSARNCLSFNRSQARQERKRNMNEKPQPLHPRERRHQEDKTKVFLMKTMHDTHVRLKHKGAAFLDDPYFIQHYLMEIKYNEGSDLTEFFLKLENAMKAAQQATHSVRDIKAQKRYTLAKGTHESIATKNERALVAAGPSTLCAQDCDCNNSSNCGTHRKRDQGKNCPLVSSSDGEVANDAKRKVFHQQRHDTGLITVATTVIPPWLLEQAHEAQSKTLLSDVHLAGAKAFRRMFVQAKVRMPRPGTAFGFSSLEATFTVAFDESFIIICDFLCKQAPKTGYSNLFDNIAKRHPNFVAAMMVSGTSTDPLISFSVVLVELGYSMQLAVFVARRPNAGLTVRQVENDIGLALPVKFGIMSGEWTFHSEHYLAVFAGFQHDDRADKVLLALSPLADDDVKDHTSVSTSMFWKGSFHFYDRKNRGRDIPCRRQFCRRREAGQLFGCSARRLCYVLAEPRRSEVCGG
ncbi:hypothetical protein ON010_g8497 [Phytophthora cinnamomi]|nr:hypothetical protein ON010_g8497 [Phytophthora cinnamomi]